MKGKLTLRDIRKLRKKAAQHKRRLVFHSDGMSMEPEKRFLEPIFMTKFALFQIEIIQFL